jgi:tight adherence protein C
VTSVHARLERAGRTGASETTGFLFLKVASFVIGAGAALWVLSRYHPATLMTGLMCALIMVAAIALPESGLNFLIGKRQEEIRRSLPDVIDLLAVSAEAGSGLDGALGVVIRRKPGALADEFGRLLLEMRLGDTREEAWRHLGERVGLPELLAFISALQQADEMGVSVANTLRAQSDAMRVKHGLLIRQQAATLATKMLFPLVFCILPALFVIVLGPGLLAIQKSFMH